MNFPVNQKVSIRVETKIVLELTEVEARALDGIFGYNVEAFLRNFYKVMGYSYVQPFEAGVRSLHKTVRGVTSPAISQLDETRKRLNSAFTLLAQAEEQDRAIKAKPKTRHRALNETPKTNPQ